jgi:hypothetical protein
MLLEHLHPSLRIHSSAASPSRSHRWRPLLLPILRRWGAILLLGHRGAHHQPARAQHNRCRTKYSLVHLLLLHRNHLLPSEVAPILVHTLRLPNTDANSSERFRSPFNLFIQRLSLTPSPPQSRTGHHAAPHAPVRPVETPWPRGSTPLASDTQASASAPLATLAPPPPPARPAPAHAPP